MSEPNIPMNTIIAEILDDDAVMNKAVECYPRWIERREWFLETRRLFPDVFRGTALEHWEPADLSMAVTTPSSSALQSHSAAIELPEGSTQPAKFHLHRVRAASAREVNTAAAAMAQQVLQEAQKPMKAADLADIMRQGGWEGFTYLQTPAPVDVVWTLYRVFQSRPTVFALWKGSRWGLKAWKDAGLFPDQEAPMT